MFHNEHVLVEITTCVKYKMENSSREKVKGRQLMTLRLQTIILMIKWLIHFITFKQINILNLEWIVFNSVHFPSVIFSFIWYTEWITMSVLELYLYIHLPRSSRWRSFLCSTKILTLLSHGCSVNYAND